MLVVLGIGSNLGDRKQHISEALQLLEETTISGMRLSPLYESEALLKDGAPANWNMPFYNMAVAGETSLSPESLLRQVKMIERRCGRPCSTAGTWAPRQIDIDILAYGEEAIACDGLQIPHCELLKRDFALIPFADLEPNWRYPTAGEHYHKTAYELAMGLAANNNLKRVDTTSPRKAAEYA